MSRLNFVFAALCLFAIPSVARATEPAPLELAKALKTAIDKSDNEALAALLVGATVPKNFKKGTQKLATKEAADEWLASGPGLETKGGEKCSGACCTFSENGGNGWGDVPSHPRKVCFAGGKIKSLELTRGGQ